MTEKLINYDFIFLHIFDNFYALLFLFLSLCQYDGNFWCQEIELKV